MKMLTYLLLLTMPFTVVGQQKINTKDSLKAFTQKLVEKALKKQAFKKIAIWDFTSQQKEVTKAGMYIADLISIYATENDAITVLDRQNINSIIREHELKDKDFLIDREALLQLGKFSGAEVLVVGKVNIFETDCLIQVYLKIVDVNTAQTLSAADENIPIDRKFADASKIEMNCLGADISGPCDFGGGNSRSPQSNEGNIIAKKLKEEGCELKNTGAYCFCNNTGREFILTLFKTPITDGNSWGDVEWGPQEEIKIKPGESKCLYDLPAGKSFHFIVDSVNYSIIRYKQGSGYDKGRIHIEKCKFKSYTIKQVLITETKKTANKILDQGIKTGLEKGIELLKKKLKIKDADFPLNN